MDSDSNVAVIVFDKFKSYFSSSYNFLIQFKKQLINLIIKGKKYSGVISVDQRSNIIYLIDKYIGDIKNLYNLGNIYEDLTDHNISLIKGNNT